VNFAVFAVFLTEVVLNKKTQLTQGLQQCVYEDPAVEI